MRYAIHIHAFGPYADPPLLAELAREAEDSGWDGVFLDDHLGAGSVINPQPIANCWIALAAIAAVTSRVRIGPMVAALPRRRPWQLAGETVTLDHLSGGRLTLGVGSGTGIERSFTPFGEEADARTRAAMLDESLDILTGLWRGEPLHYEGRHFQVHGATFIPRPVQAPRIPIWVAGHWPHRRPFRRAARWDGVFIDAEGVDWMRGEIVPPDVVRTCRDYILSHRQAAASDARAPASPHPDHNDVAFDVVIGGFSPADLSQATARLAPYTEAGLTWWVEGIHPTAGSGADARTIIRRGPPSP